MFSFKCCTILLTRKILIRPSAEFHIIADEGTIATVNRSEKMKNSYDGAYVVNVNVNVNVMRLVAVVFR